VSPHHFRFVDDQVPITANGKPLIQAPFTSEIEIDLLRINHYFSRSWEELKAKVARGRPEIVVKYDLEPIMERNKLYDAVKDTTIFPIAEKVKAAMEGGEPIWSKANT